MLMWTVDLENSSLLSSSLSSTCFQEWLIEAKDAGQGWPPLIVAEVWVILLGRAYGLLGHSCDCREMAVKPSWALLTVSYYQLCI